MLIAQMYMPPPFTGKQAVTYSSFLINISSHLQQVFHTIQMAFPSCPHQWGGSVLQKYCKTFCHIYLLHFSTHPMLKSFAITKTKLHYKKLIHESEKPLTFFFLKILAIKAISLCNWWLKEQKYLPLKQVFTAILGKNFQHL